MKIDLITLQGVKNYGSVLQAFATKKIFESYGHEVNIINYIKEESKDDNLMKYWAGTNPVKRLVMYPTIWKWKKVFGSFCKKELNISGKIYTTDIDFETYPLTADMYCTGSDQVWNSKWNNGILNPLYLNFVPNDKFKFAFAASFGQERLSDDEVLQTKKFIERYNYISVREDSAKNIVEEQYNFHKCVHIVDPTLCVDRFFWKKFEKIQKNNEEYILIYNLNRSDEFDEYAKKLSKLTGLKLKRLCMRYDQILRVGESIIIPDIFEFVALIDNAKYVLTDSFHATAFSMNMNTRPICIYPNEFGGRIDSFLKMVDSMQCHVRDYSDFDVINRSIDFDKVNEILNFERNKAKNYLQIVFDDCKKSKGGSEK